MENTYEFSGCALRFSSIYDEKVKLETTAVSPKKALNNMTYKYKIENFTSNAKLLLDGTLIEKHRNFEIKYRVIEGQINKRKWLNLYTEIRKFFTLENGGLKLNDYGNSGISNLYDIALWLYFESKLKEEENSIEGCIEIIENAPHRAAAYLYNGDDFKEINISQILFNYNRLISYKGEPYILEGNRFVPAQLSLVEDNTFIEIKGE